MIKSVIQPDTGMLLDFGEATSGPGGSVVINNCQYGAALFTFVDGAPPDNERQKWKYVSGQWVAGSSADPEFPAYKNNLADRVDKAVFMVYEKPNILAREYLARESEAQAYKDAGYTGDIGSYLQTFADNAGLEVRAATDIILSQAANFRAAEPELADLRMRKYSIQRATSRTEAQSIYDTTMARIKQLAATL